MNLDGKCIDAIEACEYFQVSHSSNVLKYIWRAGLKAEDARDDLEKAQWYADRYLSFYRSDPWMLGLRDAIKAELLALS